MLLAAVSVLCIVAAAASGAIFGLLRGRQTLGAVTRAVDALDLTNPSAMLDAKAFGPGWAPLVTHVNRLIAGRRLADLAAHEAARRARAGDGRSEELAAEVAPVLADLREQVARARERVRGHDPATEASLDGTVRELDRLEALMRGVLAPADGVTGVRADLCSAVRSATRAVDPPRGVTVTLDLEERACDVRAAPELLERMAAALIRNAVEAGVGSRRTGPRVGVYVRRMPRLRLEEPEVRREQDPGLTINPRRPNPRLERWLREGRPPAEVVKFIVADGGKGIPDDIERRLYDPGVGGGLGLTMVRRTIEQAGGTIWVQRAREGGTAFHVVLPIAAEAESRATPRASQNMRLLATI